MPFRSFWATLYYRIIPDTCTGVVVPSCLVYKDCVNPSFHMSHFRRNYKCVSVYYVHVCVCVFVRNDIWRQFCISNRISVGTRAMRTSSAGTHAMGTSSAGTRAMGVSPVVKRMPINFLFIFKHIEIVIVI